MKVLIKTQYNHALPVPNSDETAKLTSGFVEHVQKSGDRYDCYYETSWDSGFAIANVDSIEDAWALVMSNPMYPYWQVEVTPLADPLRLNRVFTERVLSQPITPYRQ